MFTSLDDIFATYAFSRLRDRGELLDDFDDELDLVGEPEEEEEFELDS